MPVPLPNLDERRWSDLVEEGRALIPVYAPEWTDHNASDPGITLMELFAWIAEMDIFRVNRIPDRHKRRFLALLGIAPAPPKPARTVVRFELPPGTQPLPLPAGTELSTTDLAGALIPFRTLAALNATPTRLEAVQRKDGKAYRDLTAAVLRKEAIAVFGDALEAGREFLLGFDSLPPAGQALHLYLEMAGERTGISERELLLAENGGTLPPHHSARVAWEYRQTGAFGSAWASLPATDGTRSLTLSGPLAFPAPSDFAKEPFGAVTAPLYWVRARFASGAYDAPPTLAGVWVNAVEAEQSVFATDTLVVAKGVVAAGVPPAPGESSQVVFRLADQAVAELSFNTAAPGIPVLDYQPPTASAAGSLTLGAVLVGTSTGEPNQVFRLRRAPVLQENFTFFSIAGNYRVWERREDLAASSRRDAHFLLDCDAGEIRFGDGEHGTVPPAGAPLVAVYRETLGGNGGLPPGRTTVLADSVSTSLSAVTVTAAAGGAPGETLAHAIGRAMQTREASLRAVTLADFENIARETPGTRIARVTAQACVIPDLDCIRTPGTITVTVLPAMPGPRPAPSQGLLG